MNARPAPTLSDDEIPGTAVFEIMCRFCGAETFRFREVSSNDLTVGIVIHCRQCGGEDQIFDGSKHGYDGELGHNGHLQGEVSVTDLRWADGSSPNVENLFASFTYNIESEELEEIARESGKRSVDLFDWFSLSARAEKPDPDGWEFETIWEFECA